MFDHFRLGRKWIRALGRAPLVANLIIGYAGIFPPFRGGRVQPVLRADFRLAVSRNCKSRSNRSLLLWSSCIRRRRDKQRGTTARHQIEPFTILVPGDCLCDSHTVSVLHKKCLVLGQPEREGIHSHLPGSLPSFATRVVTGSLHFKDARAQMSNGVASQDERLFSRCFSDCPIQIKNHLGIGAAAIMQTPTAGARHCAHFESPLTEEVVSREIMLY